MALEFHPFGSFVKFVAIPLSSLISSFQVVLMIEKTKEEI
jgi:hypothetical protein